MHKEKHIIRAWEEHFKDRGISSDLIVQYTTYIKKLSENDLPIIFEIEHLSLLIGINLPSLRKIINAPEKFYRTFSIPKRRVGEREISAPLPSLLACQDWIYKNLLAKISIHDSAHGFVPGRSILTNASPHLAQKALLKMDLKNFFPSIPINWVMKLFSDFGYANNVAFYLASICCLNESLAQGSATSPYLSNILVKGLDKRLKALSDSYHLEYTRYADDLTFSGNYIPHTFPSTVEEIVSDFGLEVNIEKTRLHTKPGQRIVTGISVAGATPSLPRASKRQIRQEAHFIQKYGLISHISKKKIRAPTYIDSIEGKLAFWLQVEPNNEFARESLSHIRKIRRDHQ